jgi:hypothetical protein
MPDFAPTIRHDAIVSERPRALYDWWATKRGARTLPTRGDFLAEELVPWWPDLVFYEIERGSGAPRFRFRVHGDNAAIADGGNFTGRFLDEVLPRESANQVLDCYNAVFRAQLPLYSRSHRFSRDGHNIGFERLLLPFGDGPVQHILAYLVRVAGVRADLADGHLPSLSNRYVNDVLAFIAS